MSITKAKYYLVLLILLAGGELYSQAPTGEFTDYRVTPDKDTIVIYRKMGDWWFGATGGANFNFDFNKVYLPWNPLRAKDSTNPLMDYNSSPGAGYFLGLTGEWLPTGKYWGAKLDVLFMDTRRTVAVTDPFYREFTDTLRKDSTTLPKINELTSTLKYLTIAPSVRYNFPIQGLHAFGGFNFEFSTSELSQIAKRFKNSGDIYQREKFKLTDLKTRMGMNLGVGWDIFVADYKHRIRINFTPYVSINAGTKVLADNGSNLNTFLVRVGLSVKFGPDHVQYDTILYNPVYNPPPIMLATLERKHEISISTYPSKELIIPMELTFIDKPKIEEQISLETTISEELSFRQEIIREFQEKEDLTLLAGNITGGAKERVSQKIEVIPGQKKAFSFASSASTKLDQAMKEQLDLYIDYLKANPKFKLGIVGHSDDQGNLNENTDRAQKRADEVVNYLIKKGIPRTRLFAYGRGSLDPIAANTSRSGQKKNRRVEIEIIPPNKQGKFQPPPKGAPFQGDQSGKPKKSKK